MPPSSGPSNPGAEFTLDLLPKIVTLKWRSCLPNGPNVLEMDFVDVYLLSRALTPLIL